MLEVQTQGVGRDVLLLKSVGENPSLSLPALMIADNSWCTYSCITPISASTVTWFHPLPCMFLFSYQDTNHWLRSTLIQYDLTSI